MDTNIGQFIGQKNETVKDTNVLDIKDIRNRSLQIFENGKYFNLAILKTEKLASALYLVSNLISDNEPIKWTMRKVSTDMLSDISLMGVGSSDKGQKISLEKITAKIFEITSLLHVAWMGGMISNMNFEILKSEYFKLGEFLKEKFYSISPDKLLVSENFFLSSDIRYREEEACKTSEEKKITEEKFFKNINSRNNLSVEVEKKDEEVVKDISYKGHIKDTNNFTTTKGLTRYNSEETKISKMISPVIVEKPLTDKSTSSDKNKIKRHNLILSLLKKDIAYTVPEILSLIGMGSELSEKTIQRDLIQLVASGSLKKTGERRWSRYQLS